MNYKYSWIRDQLSVTIHDKGSSLYDQPKLATTVANRHGEHTTNKKDMKTAPFAIDENDKTTTYFPGDRSHKTANTQNLFRNFSQFSRKMPYLSTNANTLWLETKKNCMISKRILLDSSNRMELCR